MPAANEAKTSQRLVNDLEPGIRTWVESGVLRIGAFHRSTMCLSLTADRLILMCGRYALKTDPKIIASQFGVTEAAISGTYLGMLGGTTIAAEQLTAQMLIPSFNIAPTHRVPAVVQIDQQRTLATFQWGLIPSWAKDASIGARLINARVETILEKPSFRNAAQRQHCIIPADGWFEWQTIGARKKVPHYFSRTDGNVLGLAGIYESWQQPGGEKIWSFSLITTEARHPFSEIHDRMPLLVSTQTTELWLTDGPAAIAELLAHQVPMAELTEWEVSSAVGQVRNNNPSLVEPVNPEDEVLPLFR